MAALLPGLFGMPSLLVLHHVHDGHAINVAVAAEAGQFPAPTPYATATSWTIEPGALRHAPQPDIEVKLYAVKRAGAALLCEISVRYFPVPGGYAPYYRLNEQLYFAHKNGRWIPLTVIDGLPSMVTFTPVGFANAAGYYRELTISKTTGPISLAGWAVTALPPP
ncbi:MAG: hypothetical protein M0Z76_03530 [Gammaproteobacteria bacterium]|nr:hypothetical protein [Gammaproteobacteria bacterium]